MYAFVSLVTVMAAVIVGDFANEGGSRMSHASIDAKTRAERNMPEDIIRLCVGIEE